MTERPPAGLRYAPHGIILSVGYVVFAYAAVPAVYRTHFGIDFASFGLLMSAALGAFVVAQWPASRLMQTHATADLLLAGTVLHTGLAVSVDLVGSFPVLLVGRFGWGLAAGFLLSVGATQVAQLNRGPSATLQQGVYGGMLTVGGAIGFLAAPVLTANGGVVGVHALGALLAVPPAIALWRHRGEAWTTPSGSRERDGVSSLRSVATSPVVLLASLCYVAIIASYITLSTFVTDYFRTLGVLGPLNAFVLVTASIGRSAGGVLVGRRLTSDTTLIGGAALAAGLGLVGLVALDGLAVLVLPILVMLAVSVPFGAVFNVAADATADEATALALVVAAGNLAALVLPAVTGGLRDTTGSYDPGFLTLALLNALALGAALAISRRHRPNP
jgi:predicted MFS family arabinose efflux permease